ncbi:MAG: helix-turn-helix domain-containing protein [Lachnospiraceae bacterium]|nr:helix-turn-helix domain-containing protein [Lachnospiraceae bacterium]
MYQEVMRNKNLSPEAKAIYAYLSSIAGIGNVCYPSIETMKKDLCMSENRLNKYIKQLLALGIVEKTRTRNGNLLGYNVYKITHEAEIAEDMRRIFENIENDSFRDVENIQNDSFRGDENRPLENMGINNNNINNNTLNNNNKINNIISTELQEKAQNGENRAIENEGVEVPPEPKSGILLPLNDKSLYDVPEGKISMWAETYPAVDVKQELRKMAAWLDSNPTKRKTRRGIERFINNWLSRQQDRGGSNTGGTYRDRQQGREPAAGLPQEMYAGLGKRQPSPDDPFQ